MEYFTLLIPSKSRGDEVVTFKAENFEAAMEKVNNDYPDKTYRLFRGKEVPSKPKENPKVPPQKPKK
ncbi:hypothetical protein [Aliikangiella sp. G2MR2-5]|uniref:hypothetical protein n=1 Tax=Aliikangiella sp. G2MR2-5 TaxID=2788943 RepID=UPI0018A9AE05|nr:hypothetical protein [Aliikangiella sp. G2MR2-5]